jgi:hypothetical protein
LRPSKRVRIPFDPSSRIRPIPWDIDGISMGRVAKTLKIPLKRILVRVTQREKIYAAVIEMSVPVPADKIEFLNACLN